MSQQFTSLITRFAYVSFGFVLGVFAFDQFSQNRTDSLEYALKQHAIAVQQANVSVLSFSTQTVDENELNLLSSDKAELEQEIARLELSSSLLSQTREGLVAVLENTELDTDTKREIRSSVNQLEAQEDTLKSRLVDIHKELEAISSKLDGTYKDLGDYIDRAFEGLD